MKSVGKAFLLGGTVSAFLFLAVSRGIDGGYRAADWVKRRREARERTET